MRQRRRVKIAYTDLQGSETRREVDPYGVSKVGGEWRLIGHCHLRDALRVFSVDRVGSITIPGGKRGGPDYEIPEGFNAGELVHIQPWRYSVHEPVTVTLHADPDFGWHATYLVGCEPVERHEDRHVYQVIASNVESATP